MAIQAGLLLALCPFSIADGRVGLAVLTIVFVLVCIMVAFRTALSRRR